MVTSGTAAKQHIIHATTYSEAFTRRTRSLRFDIVSHGIGRRTRRAVRAADHSPLLLKSGSIESEVMSRPPALLVALALSLRAQTPDIATIHGQVIDPSRAAISGVLVAVRNSR